FMAASSIHGVGSKGHLAVSGPPATSAASSAHGSPLKRSASGKGNPLLPVVLHTLGFTAEHDAFTLERAALTGDHGALLFSPPTVVVEHDPIAGHVHLVRPRGVREQRHIVALSALAVQYRQPGLATWIEAPRGDPP